MDTDNTNQREATSPVVDFLAENGASDLVTPDSATLVSLLSQCSVEKGNFGSEKGTYEDGTCLQIEYTISKTPLKELQVLVGAQYGTGIIKPNQVFIDKILEVSGKPAIDPQQIIYVYKQFSFPKDAERSVFVQAITTLPYKDWYRLIIQTNHRPPQIQDSLSKSIPHL